MGKWTRRAFITTGVLAGGAVVFGVAVRRGNPVDDVAGYMAKDDETMLNVWLKIGADNKTTIVVPHAEMGQGVHTSVAMMLADELDADWSGVTVVEAPSTEDYANYALARGFMAGTDVPAKFLTDTINGFFLLATQSMGLQITGGSTSVKYTGELAMRVGGASARAVIKAAAADSWGVPENELRTENSYVFHDASSKSAPYADFANAAASLKQSPNPELKAPEQFRLMGKSLPRVDIPAKVTGSADFGIDVVLPDMKYATIMAAPVFGAQVENVDSSAVDGQADVHKIVNLGDAVAVIADGYWIAKQALARLDIQWTTTGNESVNQSDLFADFGSAINAASDSGAFEDDVVHGDSAAALEQAASVVEAEYRVPYLAHATMEPMNCTAHVRGGKCELWLGTQNPLGFAMEAAEAIGMEKENVTVHNQYLGGGFGRRAFSDVAVQAARIAAGVDYPVKLIWSREEDTRHDHYRQAGISTFKASLDEAGNPTAWINEYHDKHDPADATHIPYDIANQRIQYTTTESHVPWGFWRSVDHSLHGFFKESFIDELAVSAGKDPYEYRRDLLANQPRFRAVLDLAAEKAGWGEPLPAGVGRGIALTKSFDSIVAQVVEAEVIGGKPNVRRVVCAVDAGFTVHPDGMAAQMESGIAYGLTAALYGEISIQRGSVVQSNFHDYRMLRMNESPAVETHIIDSGESMGGAGEPATPAIAPALANAIYDATGERIRELPLMKHEFGKPDAASRDVV